jgi:histidine triad (HIT) family protein
MPNCLFCDILKKKVNADIVFESENVLAFKDIRPQAPTHILIIPKKHIATLNDINAADKILIGELFLTAKEIASSQGLSATGYRTVFNCNQDAGQAVYHIHLHLLGGRKLSWPPG